MNQPAFGRRGPSGAATFPVAAAEHSTALSRDFVVPPAESRTRPMPAREAEFATPLEPEKSVDDELAEWKRSRRRVIPWRQISLMATLSLGIASLVLPDDVNEPLEWFVYALTAASMITTVAAWWKKLTHVA